MKKVSLFLRSTLSNCAEVTDIVGDRIYPIAAQAGVNSFPFLAFEHSSVGADDTKDGSKRIITCILTAVAKDALQAEQLADKFSTALCAADNALYGFSGFEFGKEDETYDGNTDLFMVSQQWTMETL